MILSRGLGSQFEFADSSFALVSSFVRRPEQPIRLAAAASPRRDQPMRGHAAGAAARDRVLNSDEIRWFWQACESVDAPRAPGAPRPFGPLLKLLLATGGRLNEGAGMRRDELSEDGATLAPPWQQNEKRSPACHSDL
jgi:integrase